MLNIEMFMTPMPWARRFPRTLTSADPHFGHLPFFMCPSDPAKNYVPYATIRALDELTVNAGHEQE